MSQQTSHHDLAARAAEAIAAAGGSAKLGRAIGLRRSAVQGWKTVRIPADRARDVSRITGIPLHQLRPDLFDPPDTADAVQHAADQAARREPGTAPVRHPPVAA